MTIEEELDAAECLLCARGITPKTPNTKDWYCLRCRLNLDGARALVLRASGRSPNNRIAHYLSDPVGYQQSVELAEVEAWLTRKLLLRGVEAERLRAANRKYRPLRSFLRIALRFWHPINVPAKVWRFAYPIEPTFGN